MQKLGVLAKEGIWGALFLDIKKIWIEGDNLSIINFVKKLLKIPCTINTLVLDAAEDLKKYEMVQVDIMIKEANIVNVGWLIVGTLPLIFHTGLILLTCLSL